MLADTPKYCTYTRSSSHPQGLNIAESRIFFGSRQRRALLWLRSFTRAWVDWARPVAPRAAKRGGPATRATARPCQPCQGVGRRAGARLHAPPRPCQPRSVLGGHAIVRCAPSLDPASSTSSARAANGAFRGTATPRVLSFWSCLEGDRVHSRMGQGLVEAQFDARRWPRRGGTARPLTRLPGTTA